MTKPKPPAERGSEPDRDKRARSPKPGAGQPPSETNDIVADEAARQKASTSVDRRKRVHRQSTARTSEAVEPDRPAEPEPAEPER